MVKKKDTVVLVNPPNRKIVLRDMYSSTIAKGNYNWPCTDLLVLSGILRDFYNVKLIDANTLKMSVEETVNLISSFEPKGVCFSFGNSVRDEDYYFVEVLRKRLDGTKFIGTGGVLYHNSEDELKSHPEIDACLLNFITDDIIKYFEDDFEHLNNVVYRDRDKIVKTSIEYPMNGFSYPIPLHEQLPLNRYSLSQGRARPLTSVLTSYGCPARCNFCVSEKIEYRYRDPHNVIKELKTVKKLGVKEIFFRDNVFCAHKSQGYSIMEMMIQENFNFSWVADTRANIVTEETAELMKKSGCHALHIGVESANYNVLQRYNKGLTIEQIRQAFKICRNKGIKTVGYFIIGLPGETVDDIWNTIRLAINLDCDYASFNVPLPIIGTSLRKEAIENRWINPDSNKRYDGSLEPLMRTESVSLEKITELRNIAYRRFYFRPRYVIKALSRCRNLHQIKMLIYEFFALLRKQL